MNKTYFTNWAPNGKEKPCNVYTRRWGWLIRIYNKIRRKNNMILKILITKLAKKIGMQKLLFFVGDIAVKATKSKKDDQIWNKVKKVLKKL